MLTLDRTVCEVYPPPVVNLVEVYAQLLAMAIQGAGKTVTLERLHLQDHAHAKLLEEELGGGRGPESQVRSPAMHALLRRARQVARSARRAPSPPNRPATAPMDASATSVGDGRTSGRSRSGMTRNGSPKCARPVARPAP